MNTPDCPHCTETTRVVKAGFTPDRSQRYRCQTCRRSFTPQPQANGYDARTRHDAINLYLAGNSYRKVAKHYGVAPQSVVNWVVAHSQDLPGNVADRTPAADIESDELFTFVGSKKKRSTW